MATKDQEAQPTFLDGWMEFFKEFQKETTRGQIILGAAWLDHQLGELITNFMIDDKVVRDEVINPDKSGRLLTNFRAKTEVAHALGLIGKEERENLNAIRQIRNRFAHRLHGLTYDDTTLKNWVSELTIARKVLDEIPTIKDNPENRVLMVIVTVGTVIASRAIRALENRRTPKGGVYFKVTKKPLSPDDSTRSSFGSSTL